MNTNHDRPNGSSGGALRLIHRFGARTRPGGLSLGAVLLVILLCWCGIAQAQRKEDAPDELLEVGVVEHLNDELPLDLPFVDSKGVAVKLGDYFDGTHPVVLTLNYSDCPMLCSLQLDGLFDGLKKMKWDLGDQYRMVTVSIDPKEATERAEMTRKKYLQRYGRAGSGAGYAFLIGTSKEIKELTDSVGFRYRYVPETGEYAHAAVTMICTPDGRLSRYLYDVQYDQQTLRLSLLEASQGQIGTSMDQFLLFCFHYDASRGKYAPAAFNLMKLGALSTVLIVGGVLVIYWRRESGKTGARTQDSPESGSEESVESL